VEETFAPGASVSVVARQHDVNTNLVFEWRRQYRQGNLINRKPLASSSLVAPDLVRIGVVNAAGGIGSLPAAMRRLPEQAAGVIEIELCGAKVRVDASIDEASLRRVLAVIRGVA
jgi:transposase